MTHKRREREAKERERLEQMLTYERKLWDAGVSHIAGVDEAGRGPLAGPVVAGAVILPMSNCYIPELNDSKKLSEKKRNRLFDQIKKQTTAIGIGIIEPREIDRLNIYQATRQAMIDALSHLSNQIQHVLIDGKPFSSFPYPYTAVVKGDSKSLSIAAASIVAKVTRDRMMVKFHEQYPLYNFAKHKGYPTQAHFAALRAYGHCPIHRRSFRGVREFFKDFSDEFYNWKNALEQAERGDGLKKIADHIAKFSHTLKSEELEELRLIYQYRKKWLLRQHAN